MPFGLKPAPFHTGEQRPVPDVHANLWAKTTFSWCWPLLRVGYSRPLEKEDLWELDTARKASTIGLELEKNFYDRVPPSRRPRHLRPVVANVNPDLSTSPSKDKEETASESATLPHPVTQTKSRQKREKVKALDAGLSEEARKKKFPGNHEGGKVLGEDGIAYDQNLAWALSKTFFWPFWSSAVFLIFSSLLQTFSPMVTKKLLAFITNSYIYAKATPEQIQSGLLPSPGPISHGIGYAIGLFVMQEFASLFQNQYMQLGMSVGMLMRTSLIANISRKFMEWSAFLIHSVWVQPIQIIIGVILLLVNLGYSALVGVATMMNSRQAQLKKVDQRVRLIQEVLNGIRVVKLYAYETFFKTRIAQLRTEELVSLRSIGMARAGMSSSMSFVPIAAAVLSFVTYSLSGHTLDAPTIFASLQLFNVIRQPLMMLPMALTVSSDAYVALLRVTRALLAEELEDEMQVDLNAPDAIRARGDFAWETAGPQESMMAAGKTVDPKKDKAAEKKAAKEAAKRKKQGIPEPEVVEEKSNEKAPFELRGIDMVVPRGALVCIVGSVGSGKSSLLQALIGEMRKIEGEVVFGGSTSYFAQSPWVQNATLRNNILFGRQHDEKRFEEIISACALEPDIAILPYGLNTEIGEKGINLSGGQKARVCLARAAYFDADIVLLDDPLSAVDAHVSKHIVDNCITTGPLAAKTRILVTHHLEVLPHADHIIMMDSGRIVEQGLYEDLVKNGDAFSRLIAEFGSTTKGKKSEEETLDELAEEVTDEKAETEKKPRADAGTGAKLMQDEERETGSISWSVYTHYFRSMGTVWWGPILFALYGMAQICTVGNSIFLGFWSAQSITGFSEGEYMAIYAAFGVASGLFTFAGTFAMYLRGISASYALFNEALGGVMRSKISWFDTTPIGRITSRLSKDITTLDNQLLVTPMQWNQLATLAFSVLGTIGLVLYTYPLLGVIFVPIIIFYVGFATFYRASSREVKRIDSVQRSFIYSNFGEMLSGMASVRAYRSQNVFVTNTEKSIDDQNQAYYLTVTLQRWLGVRLDFLGNILILGIALFGVGFRDTVSPSKLGVVLTYSLSVTQVFSQLVSVFATVEQDMNTAERVSHYAHLPEEGALTTPDDPPASWPEAGCLEFTDVKMRYRDGLPEVLRGVTFKTRPGEKVGIVGRTGAGKSSLLQALFRICEVSGGKIEIDGRDISKMGLDVLRKRLSVIPQDALLYAGTVRQNLDPTGENDDATLNDALRRAGLVASPDASEDLQTRFSKFKLDADVTDEGGNFSAGERQLVALCRALVKNSRVIVLDEATSSVDVETDATVQRAIQVEFREQSMLCIAHRLATIAFYDRVIVMDQGRVVELDTPLALFDQADSIFRGMARPFSLNSYTGDSADFLRSLQCDKAHLSRADIFKDPEHSQRLALAGPYGIHVVLGSFMYEVPIHSVVQFRARQTRAQNSFLSLLPTEVLTIIIDLAGKDLRSKVDLALVHTSWRDIALPLIWHSINVELNCDAEVKFFAQVARGTEYKTRMFQKGGTRAFRMMSVDRAILAVKGLRELTLKGELANLTLHHVSLNDNGNNFVLNLPFQLRSLSFTNGIRLDDNLDSLLSAIATGSSTTLERLSLDSPNAVRKYLPMFSRNLVELALHKDEEEEELSLHNLDPTTLDFSALRKLTLPFSELDTLLIEPPADAHPNAPRSTISQTIPQLESLTLLCPGVCVDHDELSDLDRLLRLPLCRTLRTLALEGAEFDEDMTQSEMEDFRITIVACKERGVVVKVNGERQW
ncbi:hypothetical protein RQP46_003700 [Phenoliferia psychrophenolica]